MKPMLLFPVGKNQQGQMRWEGVQCDSLADIAELQRKEHFSDAVLLSDGTLYDITDIAQAYSDLTGREPNFNASV